jgi:hypothetical protein
MADQDTDQHNSDSAGAGDDSGKAKKLAGKYETPEALEKGYKELERKYHEGNERYVKLEERINRFETERDEGYGRGGNYVEQPAERQQVQQTTDGSQFLTRFYSDPAGTLAEVEERAAQRAEARITKRQQQQHDYSTRVAAWTAENQDVAQYGDLLTHYVGQTDARLAPETRLDKAAEAVRKRVLQLKGKPTKQNDDPEQFVDGATSGHEGGSGSAAPATKPLASESQLKNYVTGRNSTARKPLQHGGPRK